MFLGAILLFAASAAAADLPVDITPDIVYGHKLGMALTMDRFQPKSKPNGAAILFMVSGGWRSNWTAPETAHAMFLPLTEKGFQVFSVRHGSSPKFNIPEIVEDVRTAVRYVRTNAGKYLIDPNRIGVYGGSAGGHLSLMLGTASDNGDPNAKDPIQRVSDRVNAVVAYFPPTDLRQWVSDDPKSNASYPALIFNPAKAPDYSPLLQVTPDDPPTLLIHGDKDTLVVLEHSEKILAAFKKNNVPTDLIVMPGAGHGFRGDDAAKAMTALVAWFEKYLAPNSTVPSNP